MAQSDQPFIIDAVSRFSGGLLRYLRRRLGNSADARDVAQETYARLLRVDRADLIRDPQSYIFRIAANLAYEFELSQRRDRARLDEPPLAEDLERLQVRSPEDQAELSAQLARLNRVMAKLPQRYRAALILHRREGMTYEEIAARLGTSVHMVKKYITTGLQRCRSGLGLHRSER
jgi:RNA polymerase sigma-70 factor (ECF subfamily)